MAHTYTIREIKDDLPLVKVKWHGKLYYGRVTGRLCKFACVSPFQVINRRKLISTILGPCFEVSWDCIAHCLNTDIPVILD